LQVKATVVALLCYKHKVPKKYLSFWWNNMLWYFSTLLLYKSADSNLLFVSVVCVNMKPSALASLVVSVCSHMLRVWYTDTDDDGCDVKWNVHLCQFANWGSTVVRLLCCVCGLTRLDESHFGNWTCLWSCS